MIKTISFNGETYPALQGSGFSARFAFPFAFEVCKGYGFDVGYNRPEWKFPKAIGIDNGRICTQDGIEEEIENTSATSFPIPEHLGKEVLDYIFSSHTLEHLTDWVGALDYWRSVLKPGGVLFLYLPDSSQKYWRPWNNRKHLHVFNRDIIFDYLRDRGYKNIFVSEADMNSSFVAMAEK